MGWIGCVIRIGVCEESAASQPSSRTPVRLSRARVGARRRELLRVSTQRPPRTTRARAGTGNDEETGNATGTPASPTTSPAAQPPAPAATPDGAHAEEPATPTNTLSHMHGSTINGGSKRQRGLDTQPDAETPPPAPSAPRARPARAVTLSPGIDIDLVNKVGTAFPELFADIGLDQCAIDRIMA